MPSFKSFLHAGLGIYGWNQPPGLDGADERLQLRKGRVFTWLPQTPQARSHAIGQNVQFSQSRQLVCHVAVGHTVHPGASIILNPGTAATAPEAITHTTCECPALSFLNYRLCFMPLYFFALLCFAGLSPWVPAPRSYPIPDLQCLCPSITPGLRARSRGRRPSAGGTHGVTCRFPLCWLQSCPHMLPMCTEYGLGAARPDCEATRYESITTSYAASKVTGAHCKDMLHESMGYRSHHVQQPNMMPLESTMPRRALGVAILSKYEHSNTVCITLNFNNSLNMNM